MNSLKKTAAFVLTGIILFAIVLVSCKKDDEPAPPLPPQSSFVMSFDDFSNASDTLVQREAQTYRNWGHAFSMVAGWNAIITAGLAVPVASFLEAFNHEAVYHPDENNWTWSYNVSHAGQTYEAELTGYFEADSVVWEMRISSNSFTDFLWYRGKSHTDQTGGYWILMDQPSNPQPLLKIDWYQDFDSSAGLRYTNVVPGGPENGGYIFYGITTGTFDRFYNIYNKGQDNLTDIEWDHTNLNGRIQDPAFYADSDWHCWNTDLQDIICP